MNSRSSTTVAGRRSWGVATYRLLIAAALLLLLQLPLGRSDLVLPPQNLPDLLDVAWAAVGLSLLYLGILRFSTDFADRPLFHWLQVSGDGLIVLLLLHYGGGLAGPFAILPLLLMISTAKLLRGRGAFLFVWLLLILLLLEFFLLGPEHTRLPLGQLLVYLLALVAVAFLADSLVVSLERSNRLTRERDVELGNLNLLNQEIIQQVDSGLLVLDRQNRVVLSNPAGRRLAGYERWQDVPVALDVVQPSLAAALRQGELHENREVSVASEGGERLSLLIRLIALPQGPYRLLILRDATELREREREAQMAALGRLAANIAHEIRNPLSSVRHATDLLREYVQDEPGSLRLFHILERETLRIDRIIDSVLEMARPRPAHPEPIVLHSWLPVLLDQLAADPRLATLRIQLPKTDDGPVVFADPAHLRQVFANLLQNAAQHAGADAAEILVEITWHAAGDGTVEIRLRDHGPGIPEESMERIFEPFFTSDARGTGLGLSMVRELLRLNHGTIAARNHREGGAEFVLELPAWDGGKIQ